MTCYECNKSVYYHTRSGLCDDCYVYHLCLYCGCFSYELLADKCPDCAANMESRLCDTSMAIAGESCSDL